MIRSFSFVLIFIIKGLGMRGIKQDVKDVDALVMGIKNGLKELVKFK